MMKGKIYNYFTQFCSLFGSLGQKIQNWAEFKEWEYWNEKRFKIVDLPEDVHIHIDYNNKGEYVEVSVLYWPMVDGSYDWRREAVLRAKFTREEILAKAVSVDNKEVGTNV